MTNLVIVFKKIYKLILVSYIKINIMKKWINQKKIFIKLIILVLIFLKKVINKNL